MNFTKMYSIFNSSEGKVVEGKSWSCNSQLFYTKVFQLQSNLKMKTKNVIYDLCSKYFFRIFYSNISISIPTPKLGMHVGPYPCYGISNKHFAQKQHQKRFRHDQQRILHQCCSRSTFFGSYRMCNQ